MATKAGVGARIQELLSFLHEFRVPDTLAESWIGSKGRDLNQHYTVLVGKLIHCPTETYLDTVFALWYFLKIIALFDHKTSFECPCFQIKGIDSLSEA